MSDKVKKKEEKVNMTVTRIGRFKEEMEDKYKPASELKSTVIEILEKNENGLSFSGIIKELGNLGKLKNCYEKARKELMRLLKSEYFEKEKRKRKTIYKIKPS